MNIKAISPLTSLKGTLNYLKQKHPQVMSIFLLANAFTPASSSSSIEKYTLQDIDGLKKQQPIQEKAYDKMIFQINVHKHSNPDKPIGTIYEELKKQDKRIISALLKFTDRLNSRQLLYLNYSLRNKLNTLYPNWNTLHFNKDCPYRYDFTVLPLPRSISQIQNIKITDKNVLIAEIMAQKESASSQQA